MYPQIGYNRIVKIKTSRMKRDSWKEISRKDYTVRQFDEYAAGLLLMREVSKEIAVSGKTIVKEGYAWLELAYRNRNVFATVMFDEKGQFTEAYFDITDGNHFDDPEDPYFEDMFLDLVLFRNGEIRLLDREELEAAYREEVITKQQYEKALREGERLYAELKEDPEERIRSYTSLYEEMRREFPE